MESPRSAPHSPILSTLPLLRDIKVRVCLSPLPHLGQMPGEFLFLLCCEPVALGGVVFQGRSGQGRVVEEGGISPSLKDDMGTRWRKHSTAGLVKQRMRKPGRWGTHDRSENHSGPAGLGLVLCPRMLERKARGVFRGRIWESLQVTPSGLQILSRRTKGLVPPLSQETGE